MSHKDLNYETKIMEEDFAKLPELPEDFEDAVSAAMDKTRRLFYKRKGNYADYHCTCCGADYTLRTGSADIDDIYNSKIYHKIPSDMEYDNCIKCGAKALLKPKRNWKYDYTWNYFYVWQAIDGGMSVRYFEARKVDSIDKKEDIRLTECMRIFFYMGKVRSYATYWTGYYCDNPHTEWSHSTKMTGYSGIMIGNPAEIYKQTSLKYCPLSDLIKWFDKLYFTWDKNAAYIKIFSTYCRCPLIEMEVKFGMDAMVRHHLSKSGVDGKINKRKKKPDEIYKIYPERVKQLRNAKYVRFVIFQREKKEGVRYTDKEVEFLENNEYYLSTIDELLKYMTLEQLMNRIEKYKAEKDGYNRSDYEVYSHYRDYLIMREELGYDMTNSVFLYPKNLKRSHDKMVKEKEDRRNEIRLKEVSEKFTKIPGKYRSLNRRYGFRNSGYVIRPARDAAEIVKEGWALHHCVGGDNYLRKHNEGRTAILFMRSEDKPDKPYVTIEVEGNAICQWYGAHDKKNVTKEAKKCIEEFENMLKSKGKRTKKTENQTRLRIAV